MGVVKGVAGPSLERLKETRSNQENHIREGKISM